MRDDRRFDDEYPQESERNSSDGYDREPELLYSHQRYDPGEYGRRRESAKSERQNRYPSSGRYRRDVDSAIFRDERHDAGGYGRGESSGGSYVRRSATAYSRDGQRSGQRLSDTDRERSRQRARAAQGDAGDAMMDTYSMPRITPRQEQQYGRRTAPSRRAFYEQPGYAKRQTDDEPLYASADLDIDYFHSPSQTYSTLEEQFEDAVQSERAGDLPPRYMPPVPARNTGAFSQDGYGPGEAPWPPPRPPQPYGRPAEIATRPVAPAARPDMGLTASIHMETMRIAAADLKADDAGKGGKKSRAEVNPIPTHTSRPGYLEKDITNQNRYKRKMSASMRNFVEWIVVLASAVAVAFVIRAYFVSFFRVKGPSMEPTLYTGERVVVNKISYKTGGEIRRFDVVVCEFPESTEHYVKRVIALPGETVSIARGQVFIGGQALKEDFVVMGDADNMPEMVVPEDSYMVMGDHRSESMDSRFQSIGPISKDMIIGRAMAITWPLDKLAVLPRLEEQVGNPYYITQGINSRPR